MAKEQSIKEIDFQFYSLSIQPVFWETLQEILNYTLNEWDTVVMYKFLKKVNESILKLNTVPHINAKCQHLNSTKTKIYRNIILKQYPYIIIYSVAGNKVNVLNIIHSSRNPKTYKKLVQ
jgi:plasmid stabilization system protein ParE